LRVGKKFSQYTESIVRGQAFQFANEAGGDDACTSTDDRQAISGSHHRGFACGHWVIVLDNVMHDLHPFGWRQVFDLVNDFSRAHGSNYPSSCALGERVFLAFFQAWVKNIVSPNVVLDKLRRTLESGLTGLTVEFERVKFWKPHPMGIIVFILILLGVNWLVAFVLTRFIRSTGLAIVACAIITIILFYYGE
jgi:hypothetical protein